jgi:hypothetical protein
MKKKVRSGGGDALGVALAVAAAPFRGVAAVYRGYAGLVDALGPPWSGLVHSTVFGSIGMAIADWLFFR